MFSRVRSTVCATLAVIAIFTLAAPQAFAEEGRNTVVGVSELQIARGADSVTRAIAQADPQAVAAAANVCGAGYVLNKGIPLPVGTAPSERLATLFSYQNSGKGCVILDNNVGVSRYMYLKACKAGGTGCATDSGNFSQYAGPVYVSAFVCAPVTAKMGTSSSSLYINYTDEYVFSCN
ncbi:hypothetical protein AB0K64_23995 [Streptomyces sp. NPDC053741]|uniref:hypothetical protein n=1 Tax=Streptomyces TaxID=1883 RepID=UPI0009983C46|nr:MULTISPECIES: hypothetical protein [Streptomyces]MCY1653413.1 hypothetical protein [Streptomyces sp. SL203]MCY1679343.1 hypothetical protein [Streptomyces sp. SL294]MDX3181838.1 hypothetical protein [Streptomyces sp. ME02-7008A-1]MDX3302518.1 hypothetical protein [Streptomyces sp. ME02-7008A]QBR08257.1 hypothetical protein D7Y56_21405 [Streptomyces sp. S501]